MIRLKAWPPPVVAQLLDQEIYLVETHHSEELKDLARYGMFSAALVTEVIQGLGNVTLSWTSHSP
ncbi:hypothetical protein HanXRQr2_Chr16g0771831 [Helianthus annuus]|uniref:Uncharacterized protein n=1 Tax=Helianthus annuus TaxID=4232 RepID=A0A9K3DWS6_HELAN|nr:hypothetical protein HanXRQr2_Chr16g0771831 [Helianthus annuus]KAJ0823101.1 hypothetical protein HanPSC8_Chr16g0739941 [Helianthus annuus]